MPNDDDDDDGGGGGGFGNYQLQRVLILRSRSISVFVPTEVLTSMKL
jgi:hypothetical protein